MKIRDLFETHNKFGLIEARQPDVLYTPKELKGRIDKVIVTLEANKASAFTRLAKKYAELDELVKALDEQRNALNVETKEKVLSYFDAEDEVMTRVVETVSMTATMSKLSKPTEKIDYEMVIAELLKLMPELSEKVSELTKLATTLNKPKSPALTIKLGGASVVKEGVAEMWASLKAKASRLLASIIPWGKKYDAKLEKIRNMMKSQTSKAE